MWKSVFMEKSSCMEKKAVTKHREEENKEIYWATLSNNWIIDLISILLKF